jgi:flagellar P-ring protein precursor FlgI
MIRRLLLHLPVYAAVLIHQSAVAVPEAASKRPQPPGVRLGDLVALEGVRDNQLIGYGLVVGLAGSGDKRQAVFPAQTLSNLLERMGVSVPSIALQAKNTAAVMVTATLPAFAQPGTRIDVTVAAMGDAVNLQGGILLLTPLKSASGQVFAAAQGAVVTGGFIAGQAGATQTVNHPTVGRVPQGGIVEQAAPSVLASNHVRLQLRRGDFGNASRAAAAINRKFGQPGRDVARAENSSLISVDLPSTYAGRIVDFIADLEALPVDAGRQSRIVINERTGTIALGGDIRIAPTSILHGNLTVEVVTTFAVSQPAPLSSGETTVIPKTGTAVKDEKARNVSLQEGATVEELVRALQAIGSTPRDVIAILQSLQVAGALNAELEVI